MENLFVAASVLLALLASLGSAYAAPGADRADDDSARERARALIAVGVEAASEGNHVRAIEAFESARRQVELPSIEYSQEIPPLRDSHAAPTGDSDDPREPSNRARRARDREVAGWTLFPFALSLGLYAAGVGMAGGGLVSGLGLGFPALAL